MSDIRIRERKRCVFSKDETMLIMNLWRDDKIQAKFRSTLKHNFIWDQLSRELYEFGYTKTGEEIKRKIQNLKHEYKTMKQIPGFDLKAWPYYNAMRDVMDRKVGEKSNAPVDDDHDYAEHETQELDEQSSGGSWMLMEIKDIAQTNSDNFQETEDPINTIAEEHIIDTDAQSNEHIHIIEDSNIVKNKTKSVSLLKPRPIYSIPTNVASVATKTTTVKRNKRPIRYNSAQERRLARAHVSENRLVERSTGIQERERRIDERERRINEREVRLDERERRVDDRERRIDERDRRLEESERYLRERERRFEERDRRQDERETNGSEAMCRFFDTCAQFLNQYTTPEPVTTQIINQTSEEVDDTEIF